MKRVCFFLAITAVFVQFSCEGYLDKYPLDSPSSTNFPQSKMELEMALNGAYQSLYKKVGGQMQDELFWDHATDIGFVRGAYESTEGILTGSVNTRMFSSHWTHYYKGIQRTNFIIENMAKARLIIDNAFCDRVEAEAKFIRAYHYMHLTERYGDVPFVVSSLNLDNALMERTPKREIIESLLSDLEAAGEVLPESYADNDGGRVTKGAALALKARIALYNEKYEVAAAAAQAVMALGYSLHNDYGELFQLGGEGSNEIIFQLSYHPDVYANTDHIFLGGRGGTGNWSITVPSRWLIDSYLCVDGKSIDKSGLYDPAKPYENRDSRLKESIIVPQTWFGGELFETHPDSTSTWRMEGNEMVRVANVEVTNQFATFTGYLWRKNWDETQYWQSWAGQGTLSAKLIRYAEVLLTYAEAKLELDQFDQSAYNAINAIRRRADMPDVERGLTQDQLRKVIRNERKIELAGEGFRLYDIRRWRIAEHVIPGDLPGRKYQAYWDNTGIPVINEYGHPEYNNQSDVFKIIQKRSFDPQRDYLWAIPQNERDLNPSLTQNPGY